MKLKIKLILFSLFGRWIIQIIFLLNKIVIKGEENFIELIKSGKPILVCVWHGRLLFTSWYLRFKVKNLYAIASKNPDGEIMARILKNWGYGLIRGSTKKRGKIVIQEMNEIFQNNGIIAITNDGPKGPPCVAKEGSIRIAINNNVNIITITGSSTKYWQMSSWDSFLLPKPFGTIQLVISPPIKKSTNPLELKIEVETVSDFMNNYQNDADQLTGKLN